MYNCVQLLKELTLKLKLDPTSCMKVLFCGYILSLSLDSWFDQP